MSDNTPTPILAQDAPPLPASTEGKPYTARIEYVEPTIASDGYAYLMVLRIRSPRQYRGQTVVHALRVDPDDAEVTQEAADQLIAAGLTEGQIQHDFLPPLLMGRTVMFDYAPPTEERTMAQIKIVGCVFIPGKKAKTLH